jgi:hypothetical protein
MKSRIDLKIWATIIIGALVMVGLVYVRYCAWFVAHPNAPTWTFFLGG